MLGSTGALFRSCVLACCLLPIMTSCSPDPTPPGTLPSDTASPTTLSSTSSATPSSPKPTSAEEEVEAAVRAYYAELTRAAQTNETTKLKRMVTKGCPCFRPVKVIERASRRGEKTPDAAWTIRSLRVHDVGPTNARAEVKYSVTAYDVVDPSGEVIATVGAQSSHFDLSLIADSDRWVIDNVIDMGNG